jgi:alkylated DNA repair protein (DNA oxidative demethylase)
MRAKAVTPDLFGDPPHAAPQTELLAPGAMLLRGFVNDREDAVMPALEHVFTAAPLRHMVTPGGFRMSVAMTNCGRAGWLTDRSGYRYGTIDPETGREWPPMPAVFLDIARRAAALAGFDGYVPDSCLINRYEPGARLSLHQDKDERDFAAPIVSVSLGLPAVFLFGGAQRSERPRPLPPQPRRCRRLGRSRPARFPRCRTARGWGSSSPRPPAHQPDSSQGALALSCGELAASTQRVPEAMIRCCLFEGFAAKERSCHRRY